MVDLNERALAYRTGGLRDNDDDGGGGGGGRGRGRRDQNWEDNDGQRGNRGKLGGQNS